jgi:cyanophycin synthetase
MVGDEKFEVVNAREIPATFGGTADFQVANSMAAIAACRAFGISREQIASRLRTFRTDADNPGRNNLYQVGKGYALVDYGHNPDGFAAICRMVSKWQDKTVTGIINIAGDRDDRIVRDAAKVAAHCFKRVIATEDLDRRGRQPGEIPRLLSETVKQENPECVCEIMPNETEAVSKAIREIDENEVVVIFYDQLTAVLDVLSKNGAVPVSSFGENSTTQTATI